MEKLLKSRAAAKGWVSRMSNQLLSLLQTSDVTVFELRSTTDDFDRRLSKLDEVQSELELELESDALEEDLDVAADFRSKARIHRIKASEKLQDLLSNKDVADACSSSGGASAAQVRLPKLELPKFKGEVTEWQSFWDQFMSHVDDADIPVISKFSYLVSLLEGEAKSVISGLSHTSANYKTACTLLKERFGRPERIIFAHVQALLKGKVPVKARGLKYVSQLWILRDELLTHIRSLEALGVTGKQCEVFLTPIILSRLPNEIRMEWARKGAGRERDLDWLLQFLQEEVESIERSETFKDVTSENLERQHEPEERRNWYMKGSREKGSSASALHASSEVNWLNCGFCSKRHKSEKCFEILKLSGRDRADRIQSASLCFKCLSKGHIAKGCFAKCVKCNGNHNILMCGIKLNSNISNDHMKVVPEHRSELTSDANGKSSSVQQGSVALQNITSTNETCTILQTAKVKVVGTNGVLYDAKLMFDSGSDRTYVSSNLAKKCKPKWLSSQTISYSAFGGEKSNKSRQSNIYSLKLLDCNNASHSLIVVEIPKICQPLIRPTVPHNLLSAFSHVELADDHLNNFQMDIDILIGLDAYWQFLIPSDTFQVDGIVAQNSVFGWILSGAWHAVPDSHFTSHQMLCISKVSDYDVSKFWDLESVGITSKEADCFFESNSALQEFSKSIKFVDSRYEVALPWKSEAAKGDLIDNEKLAIKRLDRLHTKLHKDVELKTEYYKVFDDYEREGIIEEIPCDEITSPYPTYYLPHRPVVRESSVSTKIRPVFDASARSYNGISLNDCLLTGPSLNPDLVEILIRFRRWPIALAADITKAFLQISMKREDRDVHRFFLKGVNGIRFMRFLRVPFGNTASPFLLNATIRHHLEGYPLTEIIHELKEDMYVDNWLGGADSVEEACAKFSEACEVLSHAGMPLKKWVSNSRLVTSRFNDQLDYVSGNEVTNVLGLQWCNSSDTFSFEGLNLGAQIELVFTKRSVLSFIAKIFDPLGIISPFVMFGKILFQDIWRLGISWDDMLPLELQRKFEKWIESATSLRSWSLDRCYFSGLPWNSLDKIELHTFGDASEKGYGACVYVRTLCQDGSLKVSLVASRSRVAPIKTVTLPRLELMAALLCSRLITFVKNALHLNLSKDTSLNCWTDSKIVLAWIQGDSYKWKSFVANRVTEIQSVTPPSCWQHCKGIDNPADLISRGILGDQLVSNTLWLNGPPWLSEPLSVSQERRALFSTKEEARYKDDIVCAAINPATPLFEFSRWSHFSKAQHIVAWVLRFINNCKPSIKKYSGLLTADELDNAQLKMIYCNQREIYAGEIKVLKNNKPLPKGSSLIKLDPFLDDKDLLRIKGRLEFADLSYGSKHPVIIPKGDLAKLLVSFQHKFLKHAGVSTMMSTLRDSFWIIGIRRLAKSVTRECVRCQRHDSRACSQPVAPLPELRVKSTPPFTVTGLDFAGPLFCSDFPSKKFYILLFTCAVVRAIHVELTDSMSVFNCMLAIRRFIARRGLPSVFYSDNAKTFVASINELQKVYGHLSPHWKFIVPRSPWWGGWWERLIRSVKSAVRKTLGVNYISRSELETTLHEIEACVNSRPLTHIEDEPDCNTPLTPSHFIIGRTHGSKTHVNTNPSCISAKDLSEREILRNQILDKFWKLWSNDYIRNLPPVVKGFTSKCNIKKGDLVLVKEERIGRLQWPLGVIVDVFPGKDGILRSVKVKTSKGLLNRPVQKLHQLEISCADSDVMAKTVQEANSCIKNLDERRTRAGRLTKAPSRLDL